VQLRSAFQSRAKPGSSFQDICKTSRLASESNILRLRGSLTFKFGTVSHMLVLDVDLPSCGNFVNIVAVSLYDATPALPLLPGAGSSVLRWDLAQRRPQALQSVFGPKGPCSTGQTTR
jgi:hypothetical protein